jgi:hypothetical protein
MPKDRADLVALCQRLAPGTLRQRYDKDADAISGCYPVSS